MKIKQTDSSEATELFLYQKIKNFSICGTLINSAVFADGLRFEEGIWYEDLDITPALFEKAGKVAFVDCLTYIYRQHPGSFIHSANPRRMDVLDVTDRLLEKISLSKPHLAPAAADRRFSAHCNMLSLLYRHKNNPAFNSGLDLGSIGKRCKDVIKTHRMAELTNSNVRFKNKLGALCSYIPGLFSLLSKSGF